MKTVDEFIGKLVTVIVNPLIQLMFAAAIIVFLWGVIEYIQGAASPETRAQGTRHILWGVIGLFIMVSVYGILEILKKTVFGS